MSAIETLLKNTHDLMESEYPNYDRATSDQIGHIFMDAIDSTGFIIPFDMAWQWAGYSNKGNAKRVLVKDFTEGTGYEIRRNNHRFSNKKRNGGQNKEDIMLTYEATRLFLLSNVNASPATKKFVCSLMKEADAYTITCDQARKRRRLINTTYVEEKKNEVQQRSTHDKVADELAEVETGKREYVVSTGRIDVRTEKEVIEVKEASLWKHALGQALVYAVDTGLLPRIHIFGGRLTNANHDIATRLGVKVTYATT